MSTQLENPPFEDTYFQHHLPQIYRCVLKEFRKTVQSYIFFHIFFFLVAVGELVIFLPLMNHSSMAALGISVFFLTIFSYFIISFYYQARKPEKLFSLKEMFLNSCRRHIAIPQGELHHHLTIADALSKLAVYLEDFEKNFYKLPAAFQYFNPIFSHFSSLFYWKDVFILKRLLLSSAIEEHLKQIRVTPTDLELHASLATTYIAQSKVYRLKGRHRKVQASFLENFRSSARLAMQEFEILNFYAPNDPWIHEQLALGYRELDMPEQELKETETLVKLRPQDKDVLFHLGELYFQQGMNAKGLQIYEQLKQSNFKKAELLIISYGELALKNNLDEIAPIYGTDK